MKSFKRFLKWYFYTMLFCVGVFAMPSLSHGAIYFNGFTNATSSGFTGAGWNVATANSPIQNKPNQNDVYVVFYQYSNSGGYNPQLVLRNDTNNPFTTYQGAYVAYTNSQPVAGQSGEFATSTDPNMVWYKEQYNNGNGDFNSNTYFNLSDGGSGVTIHYGGSDNQHLWGCIADTLGECETAYQNSLQTGPEEVFEYPTQGTTTPQFSPWVIGLQNLTSTDQYQISIHWTRTSNDCGYQSLYFYYQNCQIFSDTSGLLTGGTSGTIPIARPDRNLGYPADGNTQDTWSATAYLLDNSQGPPFVASTSISFTLLRYATDFGKGGVGTTSYNNPYINPDGTLGITTSTNGYAPPPAGQQSNASSTCAGDTDALCPVISFFFTPSTDYTDAFQSEIAVSKTRFPISILFAFADVATSSANNSSTYASTTMALTFPAFAGAPTTSFTIMSPTILTDSGVSQSFKDMYFDVARKVLWLTTAIGAVIIPFMG